jgi:hypothetical protein
MLGRYKVMYKTSFMMISADVLMLQPFFPQKSRIGPLGDWA